MATLVFTAVGQALGGPMGAALGGIVGRSIDESLFGPGPRRGSRLGDLSVQTSSYGSMVPRLYGTLRVAGTVVWSTDLIEEETVAGGGKGAPATQAYKYSVSMAVALSSRPIKAVKRIWADGKLIRGADGDFKVKTGFRVVNGSEDQAVDPLIAAIETIANTPAYRGQALAIFERLELGEFGNRIPQLTFEVTADEEPVSFRQVAADIASIDAAEVGELGPVTGYAAYGGSRRDAIASLVELTAQNIFDDGGALRLVKDEAAVAIGDNELGCSADGDALPRMERDRQLDGRPAALALTYHDPARDYQTGQVRVSSGQGGERDERHELAAAIDAASAKAIAERLMTERQLADDRLKVRLPPTRLAMLPGQMVEVSGVGSWQVRSIEIEGMAVIAGLQRPSRAVKAGSADGGRANIGPDLVIGRTEVLLFELPKGAGSTGPLIAASNEGLWKPVPVEISVNGAVTSGLSVIRKAKLGRAVGALAMSSAMVLDRFNRVTVELADEVPQLFNADADAIASGANLALLGNELIQFFEADDLGGGRWELRTLVRGVLGTEWAVGAHVAGERFCLLGQGITGIPVDGLLLGAILSATAHGIADVAPCPTVSETYDAEHLRPPSPCRLQARVVSGALQVEWVNRCWEGFGWSNSVDPTGFPVRVTLNSAGWSYSVDAMTSPLIIASATIPGSGPRNVLVTVCAMSDGQLSRPAVTQITI